LRETQALPGLNGRLKLRGAEAECGGALLGLLNSAKALAQREERQEDVRQGQGDVNPDDGREEPQP